MRGGRSDTIFALASGAGRAGVAVLRISGAQAGRLLDALCGKRPSPRRAVLRSLRDGAGGLLDRGLVLWMPGPASYTGEDTAELHVHGGRAVVDAVALALADLGARAAEPGEFTRRAFLNGRLALTEAEAVADLVAADTSAQRVAALAQLDGALERLYRRWADAIRLLLAQQEALIDFPDEDLPTDEAASVIAGCASVQAEIAAHLADAGRGEKLREGLVFAVTGAPNVGKSTLVNALAGREVAIVAATPGTTRDVLEARAVFGGVPVTLLDTAGLRATEDAVEAEGVRRARARAAAADVVLAVRVAGGGDPADAELPAAESRTTIRIASKADLVEPALRDAGHGGALAVSAATGSGMAALRARLDHVARALTAQAGPPSLGNARQRGALAEAAAALLAASAADLGELRGEDLRRALAAIGRLTGDVDVEQVLDTVFARFCIGK
jgi:tRNA modification GTPase